MMPLCACPATGTAPRLSPKEPIALEPGLSGLTNDPREPFTRACDPSPMPETRLVRVSEETAGLLGLSATEISDSPGWQALLCGAAAPLAPDPYAAVYAGHQFGVFVPRLGDGRALNLGSLRGWELQLKGAGPTPFARFADGRAVLRSSVREFLCSEAMHALGIPTTRALSLALSPQPVIREQVETAAVVCRVAPNFLRFGNFEYFAALERHDLTEQLVRWAYPFFEHESPEEAKAYALKADIADLAMALLETVSAKTARLMAQWMSVGFMHGVMNTDNFSLLGLTIDYGPFGFMDAFDSGHICNHSDASGRYAYHAQPQVGLWNVSRLAAALHGLVQDTSRLQAALETYKTSYQDSMDPMLRRKFGLEGLDEQRWAQLRDDFFDLMQTQHMDFSLSFRALADDEDQSLLDLAQDREALVAWIRPYRVAVQDSIRQLGESAQIRRRRMNQTNPKYVLRNWVAEEAIRGLQEDNDLTAFEEVFKVLKTPFDEHPEHIRLSQMPPDWAQHLAVSCSS